MKKITAIKVSVIVFLILSMSSSLKVYAQFDAMFTQYTNNEMFINPAYTGSKDALCITALHRQQWVGIEGRPVTTTVTMHSPVWEDKMGLGLSVLNEKIGVTTRNMLYLSYSFRVKTSSKGYLGFGIMGGLHIQTDDFATVTTDQPNDPWFSANIHGRTAPNFGFGINYNTDKFFAGISIPRLIDDNYVFGEDGKAINDLKLEPKNFHYYLTLGRVFTVSDNFKLKPSMMVKTVLNAPIQFDANLNTLIKEHLWLGASYRSKADISGLIGLQINPRFLVSYSYDFTTSSLNQFTTGSHEIVLSALFGYKGKKIASNRYF
jgi:type IX secretion system PorP/SprF family membrane protein